MFYLICSGTQPKSETDTGSRRIDFTHEYMG